MSSNGQQFPGIDWHWSTLRGICWNWSAFSQGKYLARCLLGHSTKCSAVTCPSAIVALGQVICLTRSQWHLAGCHYYFLFKNIKKPPAQVTSFLIAMPLDSPYLIALHYTPQKCILSFWGRLWTVYGMWLWWAQIGRTPNYFTAQ